MQIPIPALFIDEQTQKPGSTFVGCSAMRKDSALDAL